MVHGLRGLLPTAWPASYNMAYRTTCGLHHGLLQHGPPMAEGMADSPADGLGHGLWPTGLFSISFCYALAGFGWILSSPLQYSPLSAPVPSFYQVVSVGLGLDCWGGLRGVECAITTYESQLHMGITTYLR